MTIAVSEKYALEVSSPSPITSERQHDEYLSVLDAVSTFHVNTMIKPPPNVLDLPLEERAKMALKAAVEKLVVEHARLGLGAHPSRPFYKI